MGEEEGIMTLQSVDLLLSFLDSEAQKHAGRKYNTCPEITFSYKKPSDILVHIEINIPMQNKRQAYEFVIDKKLLHDSMRADMDIARYEIERSIIPMIQADIDIPAEERLWMHKI